MSFGTTIKGRRKELRLSVDKFAEKCGISATYVNHLESGQSRPSPQGLIYKMAEVLDLDGDTLVLQQNEVPRWAIKKILKNWDKVKELIS